MSKRHGAETSTGSAPTLNANQELLSAAAIAIKRQDQQLRGLLDQVCEAMVARLGELRGVRVGLATLAGRIEEIDAALAKQRSAELAVEIGDLREQQQGMRREEDTLIEQVDGLRNASQRLRLVIEAAEAATMALATNVAMPDAMPANSAWRVAQAQEDERQRLAREIHDGPAQALANAIFELEFCERLVDRDPEKLRTELGRLKADLRQALADVRHFIFGLRPAGLAELGLLATTRRYSEDYEARFGIAVSLDFDESLRLNALEEIAIFRIIQEALQNTRKHSKASAVRLSLHLDGANVVVKITDDGVGFHQAALPNQNLGHFGLRGMQERAQLIGAKLEIDSEAQKGTRVTITMSRQSSDDGSCQRLAAARLEEE